MISFKTSIKRYLKSFIAVLWIIYYKSTRKNKVQELFSKRFDNVHVICPGPSAQFFFTSEYPAKKEDAIILVNHALNLYLDLKKHTDNIFYFSSDGTRVKEVIELKSDLLSEVFSVISPVHLFHLDKTIIKSINVVLLPRLSFSKYFGFVGIDRAPENFDKIKKRSIATGFGSLIYSLQLAVMFNPKNIYLWGCDFGDKKGKRYFSEDVPIREIESFKKTKTHFEIVKQIIKSKGVNLIMSKSK